MNRAYTYSGNSKSRGCSPRPRGKNLAGLNISLCHITPLGGKVSPRPKLKIGLVNNSQQGAPLKRLARVRTILGSFPADVEMFQFSALPMERLAGHEFDCLMLAGSELNVSQGAADMMGDEVRLIQETRHPLLAICYGHQLVLHAFGAKVMRNEGSREYNAPEGRDIRIKVASDPEGLIGSRRPLVNVSHKDYVDPGDPIFGSTFELRAVSVDGKKRYSQYAKHRQRPIFTLQFHPECSDGASAEAKETGERVLFNFLKLATMLRPD